MLSKLFPSFGGQPNDEQRLKYQNSPNWKGGQFTNLVATRMNPEDVSFWKIGREFLKKHPNRRPQAPVPNLPLQAKPFSDDASDAFIWLGHSSLLLHFDNLNILVDPVFGKRASPFPFAGPKAFDFQNEYHVGLLPRIDIIIITHDHYDHLDMAVITELRSSGARIITSLGVAPHLEQWGIHPERISELDWWQEISLSPSTLITAVPTRHFAGRGIRNRNQTLWSGFVLKGKNSKILLGSDSGYGSHFREIGERFGGLDLAFLECGQYNENWPWIHMAPEQTVQAAIDVKADLLVPIHWGRFALSLHPWNEPVRRAHLESSRLGMNILSPMIGEEVKLKTPPPGNEWWNRLQ